MIQAIKTAIVAATGLSRDALHIYVGLATFFLAAALIKRPLGSFLPWLVVLAVASTGELVDLRDDIVSFGYWRWDASLHDIVNTVFWPTVLLLLARFSNLFGRSAGD